MASHELEIYSPVSYGESQFETVELLQLWENESEKFRELLKMPLTVGDISKIVRFSGIRVNESTKPQRTQSKYKDHLLAFEDEWRSLRELGLIAGSVLFIKDSPTQIDIDFAQIERQGYAHPIQGYKFAFRDFGNQLLQFSTRISSNQLHHQIPEHERQFFDDALAEAVIRRHS